MNYSIAIDLIPLNVAIYRYEDESFIFVDFNKQAEETEGVKKEDVLGKKLCSIFSGARSFGLVDVLLRVYEQGGHETFEKAFYEDERISGWRKNKIIKLPNGDLMAIYEDLTLMKQLEEAGDQYIKQLQQLGNILDNTMNEVFIFDAETLLFTYINQAAKENIGYDLKDLMTMTPVDIKPEYTMNTFLNLLAPLRNGKEKFLFFETLHRRKNGSVYNVQIRLQLMEIENQNEFVVIAHDVTQEHKREELMQLSREEIKTLSKVVEQIDDSVVITDKMGKITYVNQAFCDHSGYLKEDVIGKNPKIFKSGMHDIPFYEKLWQTILNGDVFRATMVNKKKNNNFYYENKTITPLRDEQNNIIGFVSSGKDVTQETLLHQEIERIATVDKLTGLFNRHKFEELFGIEAERSRRFSLPLSLILIDIDHFKHVNDIYGHDVGDEVLKRFADIIQENIRKIDIVARWGGEEFLLLCPGTDLKHTRKLAEKLRLAVENVLFPKIGHMTISLGISSLEKDDTFIDVFKRVDQGLYIAKQHGRNQVGTILN